MKGCEVAITIRFVNGAEKRNVKLFTLPSISLADLSQKLMKESGLKGEKIQFSLEGRSFDSHDLTLQKAYGSTSFAFILDARVVDGVVKEKMEETKKVVPVIAASVDLSSLAENESSASMPEHPGCKLVNEDSHDEELQCKICTLLCLDPVVLPCCENPICRGCLRDDMCPFDRTQLKSGLKEPQRIIRNMLERVEVQCLECDMVMKRGVTGDTFTKHVYEACPIVCPYGCRVVISRASLVEHEKICTLQVVACPASDVGCLFKCARAKIGEHACAFQDLAHILRSQKAKIEELELSLSQFRELPQSDSFVQVAFKTYVNSAAESRFELKV
jgi:hypothetical protein